MPRLLLLIAIGIIAVIVYRRLRATPPGQRKSAYATTGLVLLVGLVILGTVTGRMHWLGAAFTALLVGISRGLPLLIRLFPMLKWLHGRRAAARPTGAGQQSTVETGLLRMILDHDSGDMNGEVLSGDFAGRKLDDMSRAELEDLLDSCIAGDADSARLLETYLTRRFGGERQQQQQQSSDTRSAGGNMSRREALAILGLDENVNDRDIADAHRRLMQKLHPDRGGSGYLAAKLNQAKDTLLG